MTLFCLRKTTASTRTILVAFPRQSRQDDFYPNLFDWSAQNQLGVGLGSAVYLWSAFTSKVTLLCDLNQDDVQDMLTSVGWSPRGSHLAVGTRSGEVQIWDATKAQKVQTFTGHAARVGALSWNGHTLASGSSKSGCTHRLQVVI
eukprot:906364_1